MKLPDGIVNLDEHTFIHGVWFGAFEGGSVMVTLYRPADGRLLARGRIRVHDDDKLIGSQDRKIPFEMRAKEPGASADMYRRKVVRSIKRLLRAMDGAGAEDLKWVPVHGDGRATAEALQRAALKDGNLEIGMLQLEDNREQA